MAYNKIAVQSPFGAHKEAVANAAITPGHLIERMTTGKMRAHATAGGNVVPVMFALEDSLQGNEITTAYTANNQMFFIVPLPGDEIYAILANGENVAIGDDLESAGDGTLRKHVPQTESLGTDSSGNLTTIVPNRIVGSALEAVDMSGSSGADPTGRILIEVA